MHANVQEPSSNQVDIIHILGTDQPPHDDHQIFHQTFKAACNDRKLTWYSLGDGKDAAMPQDFAKLPKTRNLVIFAHGCDAHFIRLGSDNVIHTLSFIKLLQKMTYATNILLCSCYGGSVLEEIKTREEIHGNIHSELLPGTNLFIPSGKNSPSRLIHDRQIILDFLMYITPGGSTSIPEFFENIAFTIPENMTWGWQSLTDPGIQSLIFERKDRINFPDVNELLRHYSKAIREFMLLQNRKPSEKLREPTKEEIETYEIKAMDNYFLHGELDLINHLSYRKNAMEKMTPNQFVMDYSYYCRAMTINSNLYQCTPLTYTMLQEKYKQVKILLDKGATPYLKDHAGRLPASFMWKKSDYQPFFIKPLQKAKKAILCGEAYIESGFNKNNSSEISLKNAIEYAFEQELLFHQVAQKENNEDFFHEKSFPPKNEKTWQAFLTFIKACRKIAPEIQLIFALENKRFNLAKTIFEQFISLEKAIKKGKPELIFYFLEDAIPVNKRSLIKLAIEFGHLVLVEALLNRGLDVDLDLLKCAIEFNQPAIFKRLIDGTNPDKIQLQTLFHFAIKKGHITLLKDFLEKGVRIDYRNMKPLQLAISHGQADVLAMLLASEVVFINKAINKKGQTLLHLAIEKSHDIPLVMFSLLKKYGANLEIPEKGIPPLHMAIKHPDLVQILLDESAKVTATDQYQCSALHYAAINGSPHSALILIMHGAEINGLDMAGNSPLHYAIKSGDLNTVMTLLNHGASLNPCEKQGSTVLHLAVEYRFLHLVEFFLSRKVPLEAVDQHGNTPLLIASDTEIFHALLKSGANLHAKNRFNISCQDLYPDVCESINQLPEKNAVIIKPLSDFLRFACRSTLNYQLQVSLNKVLCEMEGEGQKFYAIDFDYWRLQISSILELHKPAEGMFASFFTSEEPNFGLEFERVCRETALVTRSSLCV